MARPVRARRPARTLGRPEPRRVGFIGRPDITPEEAQKLTYIGKCLAKLGHSLVSVRAKGAETALRVGVEAQGGEVHSVTAGVLDAANRTLIYPNTLLTEKLEKAYPGFSTREDVAIIERDQLDLWVDAMREILDDYGINRP